MWFETTSKRKIGFHVIYDCSDFIRAIWFQSRLAKDFGLQCEHSVTYIVIVSILIYSILFYSILFYCITTYWICVQCEHTFVWINSSIYHIAMVICTNHKVQSKIILLSLSLLHWMQHWTIESLESYLFCTAPFYSVLFCSILICSALKSSQRCKRPHQTTIISSIGVTLVHILNDVISHVLCLWLNRNYITYQPEKQ